MLTVSFSFDTPMPNSRAKNVILIVQNTDDNVTFAVFNRTFSKSTILSLSEHTSNISCLHNLGLPRPFQYPEAVF